MAVTVLATAVSATAGRDLRGCLLVASAVVAGQLSIGWSNDALDARRDSAAGRRDKPVATGRLSTGTVATGAALAAAACVPLSLASGAVAGLTHVGAVAGGWAYNLGLKRTLLSWLPYAVSFGLLPAFLTLGLPGHPAPQTWVVVAGALLGVGAHFLNTVPDIDDDLAAGVRGLPQRLGGSASRGLGALLLAGAAAVVTLAPGGPVPWWSYAGLGLAVLTAATAAVAGRRPGSRLPFLLSIVTAAVAVLLLVGRGAALA